MGWIGTLLVAIGAWNVAKKRRYALLLIIAGDTLWFLEGCRITKADIAFRAALMVGLATRNLYHWCSDD